MSSVIAPESTGAFDAEFIEGSGLSIQGSEGEENIIEVKGDAPASIVLPGETADAITTGAGDAAVFTGEGKDLIIGGTGDDIFRGGDGDDVIKGGLGDDVLIGGAGDDTLRGGLGSDLLKGGTGDDVFEFAAKEFDGEATDEIVDFKADDFADVIKIFGTADTTVAYDANTGMVSVDGKEAIDIGEGLDIEATQNENDTWELF